MSGRDNLVVRWGRNTAATDPSTGSFSPRVLRMKRCITHRTGVRLDFFGGGEDVRTVCAAGFSERIGPDIGG